MLLFLVVTIAITEKVNDSEDTLAWSSMKEPLRAVAICDYKPLRENEVHLQRDEEVTIRDIVSGTATVVKEDGSWGNVPVYFLEIADIPGATLAEQIEYRRNWYAVVDGCDYLKSVVPLSKPNGDTEHKSNFHDGRPTFVRSLSDVHVRSGDVIRLQPEIQSSTNFSVIWRGPAVERKRAKIETDGSSTRLVIESAEFLDSGPYSVVAENEYGITSCAAQIRVAVQPEPPHSLVATRNGWRSMQLSWQPSPSKSVKYCIEYKRPDMSSYWSAATDLAATKVNLRHLRAAEYSVRVFAYSIHFRSLPTEVVVVDFSSEEEGQEPCTLESQYRFGSIIADGRMCAVYNVFDDSNRKGLVAKVFSKKRNFMEIRREVEISSKLSSSYFPRCRGLFQSQRGYCLVMKRVPGVDMSTYVERLTIFTENILQLLCRQTLKALEFLHDKEIMHLDVKPANLLVSNRVVLIDFGSAREEREHAEWGDADRSFSAPERVAGRPPSVKSDVWSLGAVVCHICFGEPPHKTATALQRAEDRFSPQLLSFLNDILTLAPDRRPSAQKALKHDWMREFLLSKLPEMEEVQHKKGRLSVERMDLSRSASFDWS